MLSFRQPGDMGRYIADNDPGQIAAGFSNLEDFLAAGNKIPEYKMGGRQPLEAANPLGSGLGQIIPNPGAGIADLFPGNPNRKPLDPIMQGFQDSEFRKNANMMQQDAVNFKYDGKDMMMNSSMAGAFKQYLDSIGKGNLYEPEVRFSGPLQKVGIDDQLNPLNPVPGYQQATPSTPNTESFSQTVTRPLLDGTKGLPVTVTGPEGIASTATVPETNQFQGFDDRLTKIEEGIASLLQNRGQQSNFGMQPRFDFGMQPRFNMSGLGYFFNPQGGFYG